MPTNLTGSPVSAPHGVFEETTGQMLPLGTKHYASDGRAYRYCKVGGTALVPGKLYQAPAEVTNHQNLAPSAAAVGDTSITVTLGATAATANQYAEGYAIITVTPGQGYIYKIKSHPAASASASLVVTLEDPIEVALTTSSKVDLVLNPYSGVILSIGGTDTSAVVGVAVNNVASSSYGWLQVEGVTALLADGAQVVGAAVVASNGIAGAIEDVASTTQAIVGTCVTGIADTEYGAVHLLIG